MNTQTAQSYKRMQIETLDQLSLILMSYDKAISSIENGRKGILEEKQEERNKSLTKARDIVFELLGALDFNKGGDISPRLSALYDFVIREILQGDLKGDLKALGNAKSILSELRGSWQAIKDDPSNVTQDDNVVESAVDISG